MKKKALIILKILIFLAVAAALAFAAYFLMRTYGKTVAIFAVLPVLLVAVPLFMRSGVKELSLTEQAVLKQIQDDKPISYDNGKVMFAYLRTFVFLWILTPASLLLPGTICLLAFIPLFVIQLCVIKITKHTWITFGKKKGVYSLVHTLVILLGISGCLVLKILLNY